MAIHKDTQGPAPDGFHIPTKDEWGDLCGILTTTLGLSSNGNTMKTYLKTPFAGYRYCSSAGVNSQGSSGYYWSSSRYDANNAYRLYFPPTALRPQDSEYRSHGYSVRCFKDSPVAPSASWTTLYDGSSVAIGAGVFHNATLGLISVSGDGTTWYTIQDKNLGATTVYNDGDTLSEANCGGYFQWGNNYMFPRTGTIANQSTAQVDASAYGPGDYYSSDTFIKYSGRRDTTDNGNLRGGETNGTRGHLDIRQHGAIQTFHFKPTLMEAPELIDLVTVDIFGINFSDILNELNKYPQLYYGKNLSEGNLYTEYKSNVLGDGDGSAKVWEVTGRYITRYVVYYDSDTKVWNYYGHNISDYNI